MDGGVVGVFFILQIHRNMFWLVGTVFGWLIPLVVFIAIRTRKVFPAGANSEVSTN